MSGYFIQISGLIRMLVCLFVCFVFDPFTDSINKQRACAQTNGAECRSQPLGYSGTLTIRAQFPYHAAWTASAAIESAGWCQSN